MKKTIIMCITSVFLTGCGAVMAGKRSVSRGNANVLMMGQQRQMIEAELGAPDMVSKIEGGKTRVIYRMDPDAHSRAGRNAAVAGHLVADVLTVGLWEVVGTPVELAAQDQMHTYNVLYNSADIVEQIEVFK